MQALNINKYLFLKGSRYVDSWNFDSGYLIPGILIPGKLIPSIVDSQ